MEQAVFPQEPVATHDLPLLQKQSSAVAKLGLQALREQNAQVTMEAAVQVVSEVLGNEMCKVLELLPDKQALLLRAGIGWQPGLVGHGTVSAGLESQAGYTLMQAGPVVVTDLPNETRFNGPPLLHHHGVISGLSTPIYTTEGPWGVIGTHSKEPRSHSRHDEDFLVAVANVLGAAIDRERQARELGAAQERLQQWDQVRTRFIYNVAHELRTPLTPLVMQLQALNGRRNSMDQDTAYGVEVAHRNAQRLQDMINNFVELTKLQSNAIRLDKKRIDLAQLALEAATPFLEPAKRQNISLEVEPGEQAWVEGDADSLQRVIRIFIDNALKFTPTGGQVHVKTVREGDFGAIRVTDNGAGLVPAQAQLLFHPFTQAKLTGNSPGGFGVGLAIAKETVELHGGRIGVESLGLGQGSCFWFTVRLVEGERLTDRIGLNP